MAALADNGSVPIRGEVRYLAGWGHAHFDSFQHFRPTSTLSSVSLLFMCDKGSSTELSTLILNIFLAQSRMTMHLSQKCVSNCSFCGSWFTLRQTKAHAKNKVSKLLKALKENAAVPSWPFDYS